MWQMRISEEERKKEETTWRKHNGLPYWAAIIKVHNRIRLLKWSGIILSAYIASWGSTQFITDSYSVVQSSAERYQHLPTAAVPVCMYLAINGFPYSAFPEYLCLTFSTPCNFVSLFPFPTVSTPASFFAADSFLAVSTQHFGAVVSFPVVSCLAFSASPSQPRLIANYIWLLFTPK